MVSDPVVNGCRFRDQEPVADLVVVDPQRERRTAADQTDRLLNGEQQVLLKRVLDSVWSIECVGKEDPDAVRPG